MPVHTTFQSYADVLLALCMWREARGGSASLQYAIMRVIFNRVAEPKGPYSKCRSAVEVILCPFQFSSFNQGDANAAKLPDPSRKTDWAAWLQCCSIVDAAADPVSYQSEMGDPTKGATHYFDDSITPPAWADPSKLTLQIERVRFYKL